MDKIMDKIIDEILDWIHPMLVDCEVRIGRL